MIVLPKKCIVVAFCGLLIFFPHVAMADLVVAHLFSDSLARYDEVTGAVVDDWSIPSGTAGLIEPSGVTVGPDGNLYVSSRLTGEVLFFDAATGAPLPSPQQGGRDGLFGRLPDNPPPDQGDDPVQAAPGGLVFGPDGNLYVADNGGAHVRILDGTTGAYIGDAADGLFGAGGVAFTSSGDMLAADFGAGAIYKITDQSQELLVSPGAGGLQTPNSILLLDDGRILATDLFGNQIMQFDADGTNAQQFALIPPDIPDELPPGAFNESNFPSHLVFLPDGTLMVGVLGITNPDLGGADNGALLHYDTEGNLLGAIAEQLSPVAAMALLPGLQPLTGDYDRSGTVGHEDYELWQAQLGGRVALGSSADGNLDGAITAADYVVWRDRLGAALPPTRGTSVPEPASAVAVVAMLHFCALLNGRRQNRHPVDRYPT